MNVLDVQDKLKSMSEQQLVQEMQMPSGSAPQFLVLSEISRRKRMRDTMMAEQQKGPQQTVAEEAIAAAGVPQAGLGQMASAMAPKTDMAQNTGIAALQRAPQRMAEGGPVRSNVIVRNGKRYVMGPNGVLVDEQTGMPMIGYGSGYGTMQAIQGMGSPEEMMGPADLDLTAVNPSYREDQPDRFVEYPVPPMDAPRTASTLPVPPSGLPTGGLPPNPNGLSMTDRMRNGMIDSPRTWGTMPPEESPVETLLASSPNPPPFNRELALLEREELEGGKDAGMSLPPQKSAVNLAEGMAPNPNWMYEEQERIASNILSDRGPDFENQGRNPPPDVPWYDRLSGAIADGFTGMADAFSGPTEEELAAAEKAKADTEAAASAPTTGVTETVQNGGSGGVSVSGGTRSSGVTVSGMSSYEQELVDAIKRSEKRAEQDKWLSIAQAGMALMASTQPTLGGALGEAGMQGIGAYREGRDAAEQERMKLMEAQFGIQMARQKAASSGGGGGSSSSFKTAPVGVIDNLEEMLDEISGELASLPPIPEAGWFSTPADPYAADREALARREQSLRNQLDFVYSTYGLAPYGDPSGGGGVVDLAD
jgi:hypothetical protein